MIRRLWISTAMALVIGVSAALVALEPAAACGGFFCQGSPVDQNAERIIFTQNGDGTISAYVQIQYTGSPEAFSWILPLPAPITADDVEVPEDSMAAFSELEVLTDPVFIPPRLPDCVMESMGGVVMGPSADSTVTEFASGEVGPYGFDVIGSEDPDALVTWLRDNGYRVTEAMEPLIDVYVEEGMPFLAMQLLPEKGTQDVQPVKITYPSDLPMIPLRLTAVAANPNMAVMVWFFADAQAKPVNYATMEIADERIAFSAFGGNNYRRLIGIAADSHDGQAFITEYAAPTSELTPRHPLLQELKADYAYLTRLNTVISPEEMTVDPTFDYDPQLGDVSNIHDLSWRESAFDCDDPTSVTFTTGGAGPSRGATDSLRAFVADVGATLVDAVTIDEESADESPVVNGDSRNPMATWAAVLFVIGAGALFAAAGFGVYSIAMRRSRPYWGR